MAREKEHVSTLELSPLGVTVSYTIHLAGWLIALGVLWIFWSQYSLYTFKDLWGSNPSLFSGMGDVWLVFVWAAFVPLVIGLFQIGNTRPISLGSVFGKGAWISLNAGLFEELMYRWLRFSIAMITLPFFNLITFGLLRWVYENILIPVANWATFNQLNDVLHDPKGWVVGAAIISANGVFRDAHEYQGWFGQLNAWFMGMVLFYVMFHHGLLAAIGVHILYDLIVFSTLTFTLSWQRPPFRSGVRLISSKRSTYS